MDRSSHKRKIVHYVVPAFICLYFFLAFYPKYFGDNKEIIPFSLYNLYSLIPYDYDYFDLMIIEPGGKSQFLFYDNQNLTRIERKYYLNWIRGLSHSYHQTKKIDINVKHPIIQKIDGQVYLVRLKGDYIETFDNGMFDLEIIKRIK